ncbi:hypothetical protein COCVIDRAFT_89988 [Bipolaris victoriae FI3]|uniref:Uncharacterized protein n=1 Tax=Bipolaris victoriae (strain FI3) TaxID=930091 RepID=W7EUB7_BIPV3|nr:hypothetical protein COCVIDRAFT_89988 [Bipolaris victoriae FI3]
MTMMTVDLVFVDRKQVSQLQTTTVYLCSTVDCLATMHLVMDSTKVIRNTPCHSFHILLIVCNSVIPVSQLFH